MLTRFPARRVAGSRSPAPCRDRRKLFDGSRRACVASALLLPALAAAACAPIVVPAGLPTTEAALAGETLVMADGAKLPLRAWLPEREPPRAVVLGLHGFGDHSGNAFDTPAPLLNARGVALYAYDQRGFGAAPHRGYWPGTPTLVSDAVAAARLVRARHPGAPLYMMGESMGVAVLLVAAASPEPPPADGYVLLAPAVRGRATMGPFAAKAMDILSWVIPAVAFYGSAPGFAPTDNEEAMERWSRDPLTLKQFRVDVLRGLVDLMDEAVAAAPRFRAPALILYGAKDKLVAGAPVRRMLRALPRGAPHRIAYYAEGHHLLLRDLNRATVAEDIAAWLLRPDAPLPSGADGNAALWLAAGAPR
ncbi:MAG: alpha/beta fold hydrolase [Acetobacteraceae bacterium]|nr:alpha/beta fold hydrolase [Acetobacteraceae bacterium]